VKCTIQVIITMDNGQTETREVASLERQELTPTTLGLRPFAPYGLYWVTGDDDTSPSTTVVLARIFDLKSLSLVYTDLQP
jgi:hypothetical protein